MAGLRRWYTLLPAAILCIPLALHADVISLTDGSVIECKIINSSVVKNNKQYVEIENEKKERKEIALDQIAAIYKGETSWEIRERNMKWYEGQIPKLKDEWESQASLAKQCKQRKLDEQHLTHAKKAYELRKAEAKDNMEAHLAMARWLEKELSLFDEAQGEYRMVYEIKKEKAGDKDSEHYNLGTECEKRSLYDEAEAEFTRALELNPKHSMAKKGLERLKQIREVLVNPVLFRTVKDQMKSAVAYYKAKPNGDGSYGSDVTEAGVQGHRAQACLCGMGLLAQWEFEGADKPEILKTVPKELEKCLAFVLGAPEEKKALRGPDVWGNVWSVAFLAQCLKKHQFKGQKEAITKKIESCYGALTRLQGPDGGWSYYDFARNKSAAFVTAAAIVHMHDAKKAGVPIPDQIYQRAVNCLKGCKQSDGIFMYATGTRQTVEGSQGRAPLCEMALHLAGQGSKPQIQGAIENFFKYRHILTAVKGKRGTHMGKGGTAPYYYLFGHYWAARAIKQLDKSAQNNYLAKLRDVLLPDQEGDGCFWDFPMPKHHKEYGSALAGITLHQIATMEPTGDPKLNPGR
jgi:hypothetical protein